MASPPYNSVKVAAGREDRMTQTRAAALGRHSHNHECVQHRVIVGHVVWCDAFHGLVWTAWALEGVKFDLLIIAEIGGVPSS